MTILKPFILVGCVAFTTGLVGYWAWQRLATASAPAVAAAQSTGPAEASTPAPAPADDLLPSGKRI